MPLHCCTSCPFRTPCGRAYSAPLSTFATAYLVARLVYQVASPSRSSRRKSPTASKFRVFGCTIFAKVPDKLRRKLREKAFCGILVGYPPQAPGYRINNPAKLRITTSVHVVFREDVPGFPTP
jgi:hypothetical protein